MFPFVKPTDLLSLIHPSNTSKMKQKIVIKVQMNNDKCQSKVMKLAASASGVDSVSIEGENKDHLVVAGDGVDPITLTRILRKKVGYANIVRVEELKKKFDNKKSKTDEQTLYPTPWYPNYPTSSRMVAYDDAYYSNPNTCSLM